MSVQAVALVLEASKSTHSARLVLIAIANHDGDGGSWPTIATLGREANLSAKSVHRALADLQALGELEVQINRGGTLDRRNDRRPNRYRILLERGGQPVTPVADGVDNLSRRGGQLVPDGVDNLGGQTISEPSTEPSSFASGSAERREEALGSSSVVLIDNRGATPIRVGTGHEPLDRLCATLVDVCGYRYAEMTAPDRRACAVAARQLHDVEATSADITTRAHNYTEKWPGASLTPTALARRWAACANPPRSNHPAGRKTTAMRNVADAIQAGQL